LPVTDRTCRWAAIALAVGVLLLSAVACSSGSGGSSTSQVTPADVNRYVLTKEATANLTRVVYLISAADQTVGQLSHTRPGSVDYRNLLYGARLSWNNVVVGLNAFTQGQAVVVPQLTSTVGEHKLLTTTWLNALDALRKHPPKDRRALLKALSAPQKQELDDRHLLQDAAAALAKETCALQLRHPELASAADTATACGAAKQLSSPPST
jgi:hypothetical protein